MRLFHLLDFISQPEIKNAIEHEMISANHVYKTFKEETARGRENWDANKRVRNLAVSKEPWDISEVIRDKHGINKNIPGLGPQKKYSFCATSAAEIRLVYLEWPLTDACANEIPNSLIQERFRWNPEKSMVPFRHAWSCRSTPQMMVKAEKKCAKGINLPFI